MDFQHCLHRAINPRNIVVIGASDRPGSLGSFLWRSIAAANFSGNVFAVNPKYKFLGDLPCYASLKDISEPIDLAVLAVPPQKIEALLPAIAKKGVSWVILPPSDVTITSQRAWQVQLVNQARSLGLRVLGSDSYGIMRPSLGLNATFWPDLPASGEIGFVTQSGIIGSAVLSYAKESQLGFSCVISTGNEIDASMSDAINYLAHDSATKVIVLHIEGLRNPRDFYSAIREAAHQKPVIILRGGKSEQSAAMMANRQGIAAGDDQVFNAMVERAGAIRVSTLDELLAAIEMLSERRLPRANRLGIICNGADFGVLAADTAERIGIPLAKLSMSSIEKLQQLHMTPFAISNPVDIGPDADPRRIKLALDILTQDENVDGVLVITAPSVTAPIKQTCDALAWASASSFKPLITAWVGEFETIEARRLLLKTHITALKSPEWGIKAFSLLAHHAENQRFRVTATPEDDNLFPIDLDAARRIIETVIRDKRDHLNEFETKRVLACIGLTTASGMIVNSAIEAVDAAKTLGMPVVLKVLAEGLNHKSNVGGVALDLRDETQVFNAATQLLQDVQTKAPYAQIKGIYLQRLIQHKNGRELAIEVDTDPCFGPVMRFGTGGRIGELYGDMAVELLPLTEPLANQLIQRPLASKILGDFRGMPAVNLSALRAVMMRLSTLVTEIPAIRQLKIDPLLVDDGGCIVLDASITLGQASLASDVSASHMMICPEPRFENVYIDIKNAKVRLRSMRAEDYGAVKDFLSRLSPQTAYLRFHISSTDLAREKIVELTNIDYNREIAIVAEDFEEPDAIRAVARFKRIHGSDVAEFGIVVEDEWQRRGLAKLLMNALHQKAKNHNISMLVGYVLRGNESMFALMESLGYTRIEDSEIDNQFITFTKKI